MGKIFLILGIVLVILILVGIGMSRRVTQNGAPVSSSSAELSSISSVAKSFYDNYQSCMTNPPPAASGQVSTYCQSHNPDGGVNLVANLEKGGVAKAGADPILCAQNTYQSLSATNPAINGNQGSATVVENFGGNLVNINVNLDLESGTWKVSNIICPTP